MTTIAQELRDVDVTCPWKQPYRELRLRAADEIEALQKEVERLKNVVMECESFADAQGRSGVKFLEDLALRAQNQELREALELICSRTSPVAAVLSEPFHIYGIAKQALALKP